MAKKLETAEVIDKQLLCEDHYFMRFKCPEVVADAAPGQFVNILTEGRGVILRRPFSFMRANADEGTFDIIFRVVGKGTGWLQAKAIGDTVDVLGPLGTGYNLRNSGDKPCIVGGGVGIPPLIWVVEEFHRQGKKPLIYLGGRITDHLFGLDGIRELGIDPVLATEDGSTGEHGFITGPLERDLKPDDVSQVYACGRIEMLRTLTGWGGPIAAKIQISLECKMACGFGVCLGCAAPSRNGGYVHVCTDGPVFTLDEVDLSGI